LQQEKKLFCHYTKKNSTRPNENPPTAKSLILKPSNCSVNGLQLVEFLEKKQPIKPFSEGGGLKKALHTWRIFRITTSQLVDFY